MTKSIKYFFGGLFLGLLFFGGINLSAKEFSSLLKAQVSEPINNVISDNIEHQRGDAPEINAKSAISMEITAKGQEKILLQKNIEQPLPIASLSKLMTALVVFENPEYFDFSKIITISKSAANQTDSPNYGNLKAGDKYTLEKLMELTLVYSSNDAAFAISEIIGSDKFLEMMNQKAARIGMNYTYFQNPNGLDEDATKKPETVDLNYSTAKDLATLSKYILKNQPEIFEISAQAKNYETIENGFYNLNFNGGQKFIGGKTGYTDYAGGCLIVVQQDNGGNYFINVILGTKDSQERIIEMQKIINWLAG
jgi:serine-type D-Ala-D-Ala carboxypeptidase (penicillin-binding protein 5/6)